MLHNDKPNKKIHHGRNVKRFRELLGVQPEAFGFDLGEDWNRQRVSLLEEKEHIEPELLRHISKTLNIPVEVLESFEEMQALNIVANTFNAHDHASGIHINHDSHTDFMKQWLAALDENKKLYERMLLGKDEVIKKLEAVIEQMSKKLNI